MFLRHLRHVFVPFLVLVTMVAPQAHAYQFTGEVKTLIAGTGVSWLYWQKILLEEDNPSVGGLCISFARQLSNPNFTADDCLAASETLSGVTPRQHRSLPVGTAMWVPYMPFDFEATAQQVQSTEPWLEDLTALRNAFEASAATQLSEATVAAMLEDTAASLYSSLLQELEQLRDEVSSEREADTDALLERLGDLEAALVEAQPVAVAPAVPAGPSAAEIDALTERINELANLRVDLTAMEARLLAAVKTEVEEGLAGVATVDAVSRLSEQVTALGERVGIPPAEETSWWTWVWWWFALLTLAVAMLMGVVWLLFHRSNKTKSILQNHGQRLDEVEDTLRYVVIYTAQKRFECKELTDKRLNSLSVGETIPLQVIEEGSGAVHPNVDVMKGVNKAGDEYLILVGTKNANAKQINPKSVKGEKKFTVAQVFKSMSDAIENDEIEGVTAGRSNL